jgi:DNA-binding NtrC family response regulator
MGKILIVDDQSSIRELLSHLFRRVATVMTTGNLEEAQDALANHKFDLVISDLRLNKPDGREGLELLSYVQEISPETKVILMSGFGSDAIRNEAYSMGAMGFFEKPLNISHLLSKVQSLKGE